MGGTELILVAIVSIALYVAISRWIFKVNQQVTNQEIMIDMLGQLLLQQGLSVEEIKKLLAKYKK